MAGFPKLVLISRKLLSEKPQEVLNALRLFSVGGAVCCSPQDAELARLFTENILGFTQPFVVVADFADDMQVINDDGSVDALEPEGMPALNAPHLQRMN